MSVLHIYAFKIKIQEGCSCRIKVILYLKIINLIQLYLDKLVGR